MCANDDKRIQSIDSTGTYVYGTKEEIIHKKEEFKCINKMKQHKKLLIIIILQRKHKIT